MAFEDTNPTDAPSVTPQDPQPNMARLTVVKGEVPARLRDLPLCKNIVAAWVGCLIEAANVVDATTVPSILPDYRPLAR